MKIQYAMHDNPPMFYTDMEESYCWPDFVTKDILQNRQIGSLIRSFGYSDFFIIPIGECILRSRILLEVATKDDNISNFRDHVKSCKNALQLLAEAIDYIGRRKFPKIFMYKILSEPNEVRMTPQRLKVLETLAAGDKTLPQAADHLGISIHTINKHIAEARKALGASTIPGAVYKAIKTGLIHSHQPSTSTGSRGFL